MSDKIAQRLSENVSLICLDHQYDKIENTALNVLTDLVQEFALEIGREIKSNAEIGGRAQPNLVDALNASYEYGYTKKAQMEYMKKTNLSFMPYKQDDLEAKLKNQNVTFQNKLAHG